MPVNCCRFDARAIQSPPEPTEPTSVPGKIRLPALWFCNGTRVLKFQGTSIREVCYVRQIIPLPPETIPPVQRLTGKLYVIDVYNGFYPICIPGWPPDTLEISWEHYPVTISEAALKQPEPDWKRIANQTRLPPSVVKQIIVAEWLHPGCQIIQAGHCAA